MGSLALIAVEIGRRSTVLNALAFSAAVMACFQPRILGDIGFQLSFAATLGLVLLGDRFQTGFLNFLNHRTAPSTAQAISKPVGECFLLTLAAQIATLPIILYHFGRLSLSAMLANPLILPVQPLLMVLSGLAVLAGLAVDPLAHLLAWLAWPLNAYTIRAVEALAALPGGVVVLGDFNFTTLLLVYGAVLAPLADKRWPALVKSLFKPALLLTGAALLAALLWRGVLAAPDGRLRLIVFDIDGSQVALVRSPTGETLLVNGGPSAVQLNDILGRYPPRLALWGCLAPDNRAGDRLVSFLADRRIPAVPIAAGEVLALGSEVRLEVLARSDEGSALHLKWKNFRALIPSGSPVNSFVPNDLAELSLLVLDARDLEKSTVEEWLAIAPRAVIATPENDAVLPDGLNWMNTRPQGWYQMITDGMNMWVEQSR